MEIINCEQGSEEWLEARLGYATASNFSKIVTSTGEISKQLTAYAIKLASERLTTEQEESYTSRDMEKGNELEPEARQAYQEYSFSEVEQVGFMVEKEIQAGYSPDGLVSKNGLIEIKCPNQTTHTKYLYEDRLPVEYKAQVQGGLLISGRQWCDFISYNPSFRERPLFIKRVLRDESYIASLQAGIKQAIGVRDKYLTKIILTLTKKK